MVLSQDGDLLASVSYPWPTVLPGVGVRPYSETAAR